MESEASLVERLRDRVVGGLHRGTLHAGDRLEGVREIARRTGMNARAVARAYRTLEAEGLVEVRGRSGVYVALQERREGEMLPETARWTADVLVEAWRRMIKLPEFPGFIRRYTASVPIRCAVVESVEDLVRAYAYELRGDWGLEVNSLFFDVRGVRREEGVLDFGHDLGRLMDGLQDADLIVTTNFYARPVQAAAEALGKPVVILTTHPEFDAAIHRRLDRGQLTAVVADPRCGERMHAIYDEAAGEPSRLRVLLASDAGAVAQLDPADIPEGFATIATFKNKGVPRARRILLSASFALPILIGATLGYWAVRGAPDWVKLGLLAFTAGILLTVAVEEIVVEAHEEEDSRWASLFMVGGFALFALLASYFE